MNNTAVVIFSNGIGGAERVVEKIVRSSIKSNYPIVVIANSEISDYYVSALGSEYVIDAGPLHVNSFFRKFLKRIIDVSVVAAFFKRKLIQEIVKKNNIDVVITNLMYDLYAVYNTDLGKTKKIAIVHGLIGISDELPKYVFNSKFTRDMLLKVDRVISVSSSIERYIVNKNYLFNNRVTTIENGVSKNLPVHNVKKNDDGSLRFLFCGGTKKIKGGFLLYTVARKILETGVNFELTVAGPVEDKSYWHKLKEQFPKNIDVVGFIDEENLYNLVSNHNFVIMPSISEGAPLVAFDAIKINTPVLASKIQPFTSYLNSAYLFDLDEKSLNEILLKCINDPTVYRNYSFIYSPLDWDEVWQKYIKVIRND
jgi:glycosyltransferase involved in cell wall biosynthesis